MVNPFRGEVSIVLDGRRRTMRLTLGALAALEAETGADGVVTLVRRFEDGAFTTRDVVATLHAGLRGGGWDGSVDALLDGTIEGGPIAATRAAALLLGRAFTLPEDGA